MNKSDILLFISFILIIASLFIFAFYSYTEKVNKCTSDPLKFAVNKINETYDPEYIYGYVRILKDGQSLFWEFGDINGNDDNLTIINEMP